MIKSFLTALFLLSTSYLVHAQTSWEKTYGTAAFEEAKSVRQTADGGYIIGGTNLVKVDQLGNEEWTQPHPCLFANPTSDNGYILINHNSLSIEFIKTDANGTIDWQTSFSGGIWANEGTYIEETNDGGFIVSGRFQSVTGSGMLLLKLDHQGNVLWQRTYSEITSAGFNYGLSAQQTSDNGFIITGYSYIDYYEPNKHRDIIVVKTDSSGNEQWRRFFGGINDDTGYFVKQANDGNYFIAGTTNSYGGGFGNNMYLLKLNAAGDSLWTKTYGGNFEESATGLWATNDGGCILSGSTNTFSVGGFDGYIVKTDANGNVDWTKTFGGFGTEVANSVQQTADAGYIVAGYTNSAGAGDFDMYLLKIDSLGNFQSTLAIEPHQISSNQPVVFPNPGLGVFSFRSEYVMYEINIKNLSGQQIYSAPVNATEVLVDLSQYPKGMYFYSIIGQDQTTKYNGKVVIE